MGHSVKTQGNGKVVNYHGCICEALRMIFGDLSWRDMVSMFLEGGGRTEREG